MLENYINYLICTIYINCCIKHKIMIIHKMTSKEGCHIRQKCLEELIEVDSKGEYVLGEAFDQKIKVHKIELNLWM